MEGPSPVTVVPGHEIALDGLAKIEDVLNRLPQVYASQGSNSSNGATGTANVDLRNLGADRNLVLMNGRRLPPGSVLSYAADLNQVPAPLIRRVELLTGGASAVYGSDAITGVVNFIMNDRFEGVQADLYHAFYNHQQQQNHIQDIIRSSSAGNASQFQVPGDVNADGNVNGVSLLLGRNFADDKGNATLFFSYKKEAAVTQTARDFSACSLNPGDDFTCGGSPVGYPGRFRLNGGFGPARSVADEAGNTRPVNPAVDVFNFGPYNYYRRPSEQYGFNAFAHLDVAPNVRVYSEFGFHDNHTEAQLAPSGSFGELVSVHYENPLLSSDWKSQIAANNGGMPFAAPGDTSSILILRRNVEGDAARISDLRHTSYRAVLGAKGEMFTHWTYDAYAQYGKVLYQSASRNDFSRTRIGRALDVITDPATGQPACRSFVSGEDPNCVPWNIWRLGGVTQASVNYLQTPGLATGQTQQSIIAGTASTDLGRYGIKFPTARTGVGVLVGIERRQERLSFQPDATLANGDLAGLIAPLQGFPAKSLESRDFFGEVRAPLIERRRFADLLSVSGSYRRSDYSSGKSTHTYGIGAEWAPVRSFRLRTSYQVAVRHPNTIELYEPQGPDLFGMPQDPCGPSASGGPPTATLEQCARTGITPAQYGSAVLLNPGSNVYSSVVGGNPDLNPERAHTWTAGLVMTPTGNLTASIDWWAIRLDGAVGAPPPEVILDLCLKAGELCQLIRRDALGTLWLPAQNGYILATNQNVSLFYASGVDAAMSGTFPLGNMGSASLHVNGVYVLKAESQFFPATDRLDCLGLYGFQCGTPNPRWRHKIRGIWITPWNVDMAVTWRHIDAVMIDAASSQPALNNPNLAPSTDKVMGARDYLDVAAAWTISKIFTVRAGINNILDKDPPIVSGLSANPAILGNGNTFPQFYDALGRLVFTNLTMKF